MSNPHLVLKNHVAEYRKQAGWSQSELAEKIHASRDTVSKIENAKFCPSAFLAAVLCAIFNCKFEDLFYLDQDYIDQIM